jgi:transcriptional regulator with XRE-family HTH domain
MRRDVQARIRKRIRDRLDDLKMTARELARAVGHDDAWISGILSGSQGLHWKDFDAVAEKLGLTPSELVRHDDAEVRELTPTIMRMLRHFESWPDPIKHRWLDIWDFYAATAPEGDLATLMTYLRDTPRSLRGPTTRWLARLAQEGIPPEHITGDGAPGTGAAMSSDKNAKRPVDQEQIRRGGLPRDGDHFRGRRKSRLV